MIKTIAIVCFASLCACVVDSDDELDASDLIPGGAAGSFWPRGDWSVEVSTAGCASPRRALDINIAPSFGEYGWTWSTTIDSPLLDAAVCNSAGISIRATPGSTQGTVVGIGLLCREGGAELFAHLLDNDSSHSVHIEEWSDGAGCSVDYVEATVTDRLR